MNRTDIAEHVSIELGLSIREADRAVVSALTVIADELRAGGSVTLVGFGAFDVKETKATTGRNPRTGEAISIPAGRKARFKASKSLLA